VDAGAEILWVLEQDPLGRPGTAESCLATMDRLGSSLGWCVGDNETQPEAGTFDESPFSVARGFDIVVVRETMQIVWTSSHGTPSGNDNLSGEEVVEAVRAAVEGL
jgi:hypothetical protein